MRRFIVLLIMLFSLIFPAYSAVNVSELPSETGRVLSIEYDDSEGVSQQASVVRQIVQIEVLSGNFRGEKRYVDNMLTGNPAYDIQLKKGDKVVLHVESKTGEVTSADDVNFYIADIKRDNVLWFACGLFCLFLVIIGRKKGVYSLISIFATTLMIFAGLVPMILNGIPPIFATVIVGILSTVVTIYLVGGFNAKSSSAIIGTVLSLCLAGVLSALTIFYAGLTGFDGEESIFLYTTHPELNFKGILASAMIIAALGALMDTAVSIASTINEIYETDNKLSVSELFKSGMNVGRDIIGTMSNTLILVYIGSSLTLVLLSSYIDLQKFFNLNQVATEISSAIIGSIAILLCVPLTAVVSAFLIKRCNDKVDFNFDE